MKRISFGDDARHLASQLLEHAGAAEVPGSDMTVVVQPETLGAARALLLRAALGHWTVELLQGDRKLGSGTVLELYLVNFRGVSGYLLNPVTGRRTGGTREVAWSQFDQIHLY